jgi:predicted kinase
MSQLILVIVCGPSGTGKTTLAEKLSSKYNLPLIYKDGLKEILFDNLGIKDRAWSRVLGNASHNLLNHISEQLLKTNISHIIEAPFMAEYENKRLCKLKEVYNFIPIQIQLRSDRAVIFKRMKQRVSNQARHPGHSDDKISVEQIPNLIEGYAPLEIGGVLHSLDTTDFNKVDLINVFKSLDEYLK